MTYEAGRFAFAYTGAGSVSTMNVTTPPVVNIMRIGAQLNGGDAFGGTILSMDEYNGAILSDAELLNAVLL